MKETLVEKYLKILVFITLSIVTVLIISKANNNFYKKGYQKGYDEGKEIGITEGKDFRTKQVRDALIQCGNMGGNLILSPTENGVNFRCMELQVEVNPQTLKEQLNCEDPKEI